MVDDFTATVVGAAIAGGIGLFTVLIQQRWQRKESVNEIILGPLYNFLVSVEQAELGRSANVENPWDKVGKYDRLKVPKKIHVAIDATCAALKEYETAQTDYSNFAWQVTRPGALSAFTDVLRPYRDSSNSFPFKTLGILWDGSRELGLIYDAFFMHAVRHVVDPDAAWKELEASEVGDPWFNGKFIAFMRKQDPDTLVRLHRAITSQPEAQRAAELLKVSDLKQVLAVNLARAAHIRIQRRLKVQV